MELAGTVMDQLKVDYFGYFRQLYTGTIMANLGIGHASGNEILAKGNADQVSFGTHLSPTLTW